MAAACTYTPIHAQGVETDNIKTACIWQVSPGYKQEHQYTGMQAQQMIERETNVLTDRQTAKQSHGRQSDSQRLYTLCAKL